MPAERSALAGCADRRHGRAQVVRDGAQHGRLHLVAAPQRGRLDDLGLQPLARERGREDRLERRHDPLLQPLGLPLLQLRRHDERADPRRAVVQRDRGVARIAAGRFQLDRRRSRADRLGQAPRGDRQPVVQPAAAEQQPRQLRREVRLAAAVDRLRGPRARRLRERAGSQRDGQEREQRNPVAAVGDREAADRGQVEEVERRRARKRRQRTEPEAPIRRQHEHGRADRRRRARRPARSARAGRAARSPAPPTRPSRRGRAPSRDDRRAAGSGRRRDARRPA